MNERPTPETDEQINGKPCTRFDIMAGDSLRDALVPSEFARKLERERDEARTQADNLAKELEGMREAIKETDAALRECREQLDRMTQESIKERATAALAKLQPLINA